MLQPIDELERFYSDPDPWNYDNNSDDQLRVEMLIAELPHRTYSRTLDIGCGNGFLTRRLPGEEILGADISEKAIFYARERCTEARFSFVRSGILELTPERFGTFDLIVLTGVLYPQYVAASLSLAKLRVDAMLKPGGILAHCHIMDWWKTGFPYDTISRVSYPYRNYYHMLEICRK